MGWADILLRGRIRIWVAAFEEVVAIAIGHIIFWSECGGVALFRLGDPGIAPGIFVNKRR